MVTREDNFVSGSVENHIVLSLSNYFKYQGYIYNLSKNNLENGMHAAISDFRDYGYKNECNKLQSQFLSRCVFSNID